MKAILFLGSGNSIESGLPSVYDISEKIYNGPYNYNESDFSETVEDNRSQYIEGGVINRMRRIMKTIQEIDDEFSAKSAPFKMKGKVYFSGSLYKGKSNYEDLYFILNEIKKSSQGLSTNSTIISMILHIEERVNEYLIGETTYERIIDLGRICTKCVHFLDWLIPRILVHKRIKGLNLVLDIAKNFKQLDIITLNHDLLIEDLFRRNNIEYDDGFNGNIKVDSQSFSGFRADSRIKLIKPHGSINWTVDHDGYSRLIDLDIRPAKDFKLMRILTGTNKILAYNRDVFAEMFYQLHTSLKQHHNMIMSGYGFGDEGINMRIGYWLKNTDNCLTILHKYSKDLIESSYLLSGLEERYLEAGRLRVIEDWLANIKYEKLIKTITNSEQITSRP